MVGTKHFQISGMKNPPKKGELLQGIKRLGGTYIGGSVYKESTTHLIVTHALASEKFLAACAGGKWIVTPEYVLDSVKRRAWLPEAPYELDLTAHWPSLAANPLHTWREKVASGVVSGAFQDWVVLLEIDDPISRDMFRRILNAGKAIVYSGKPAPRPVTHVLTKHETEGLRDHDAPCYTTCHLAQHLFGSFCSGLNWSICQSDKSSHEDLFSELEAKLLDYVSKLERQKKTLVSVPEFQSYYACSLPSQIAAVDFSNVLSLIECGLFPQALEEIQGSLQPGVLPPAPFIHSLMQHALHGDAKPYFLSTFRTVLHDILRNNPPWASPVRVKYFLQILQCPECKKGVWSFMQTSVRVCLSSAPTCHSLPSPAPPELIRFHGDLQAFVLRLFQLELHASSSGGAGGWSAVVSLFWNVWERATLSSRTVQQLAELLIEATLWALPSAEVWRRRLVHTLQETLAVVVEFWCHVHSLLNRGLMERGLEDLAEYVAIVCQDLHPDVLKELVHGVPSPRLRMVTADAFFRSICCRNGVVIGAEPLSLLKIVSSYLKALGGLCGRRPVHALGPPAERTASQGPGAGGCRESVGRSGLGKENIPRGYHRVNSAGETLLHRACKRNQVDTLLSVLALPETDVNVKDHAGWTPLHEACNHGSSECVQALLQHCPALNLITQVGGVSPLHDAINTGHVDIAKMLLQYAGSSLLQLQDSCGRTPLDLVTSATLREELRRSAQEGDAVRDTQISEVRDLSFVEACSCLLSCLLLSYLIERDVPSYETPLELELTPDLARALVSRPPGAGASVGGEPRVVRLAQDLETLLGMGRYLQKMSPALRDCQGPHTSLLVQLLEDLAADGRALLSGVPGW